MEDGDMVCGNCILEQVEPTFSVNALYVFFCICVSMHHKSTRWTQKHSLISSSYKIKTYWNILTKLVATVA